jgi:hypothetical protein
MWLHAYGPEPESEISFHANWRENRLVVSGTFPKSRLDPTAFAPPYGVDRPNASVSMDRTPQRLADDLCRRVVFPYLALLEEAVKRRDAYDADRRIEAETSKRLARLIGVDPRSPTDWYGREAVYRVQVHAADGVPRIHLDLHYLALQTAEEIIRKALEQAA